MASLLAMSTIVGERKLTRRSPSPENCRKIDYVSIILERKCVAQRNSKKTQGFHTYGRL